MNYVFYLSPNPVSRAECDCIGKRTSSHAEGFTIAIGAECSSVISTSSAELRIVQGAVVSTEDWLIPLAKTIRVSELG